MRRRRPWTCASPGCWRGRRGRRARAESGAPPREILAALGCYRELLELRAAEAEAPAPQLHLEAACLALSGAS